VRAQCDCLRLFVPRQNRVLVRPRQGSIHRIFAMSALLLKLARIDYGTIGEHTVEKKRHKRSRMGHTRLREKPLKCKSQATSDFRRIHTIPRRQGNIQCPGTVFHNPHSTCDSSRSFPARIIIASAQEHHVPQPSGRRATKQLSPPSYGGWPISRSRALSATMSDDGEERLSQRDHLSHHLASTSSMRLPLSTTLFSRL